MNGSKTFPFPWNSFLSVWRTGGPYPHLSPGFRDSFVRSQRSAVTGGGVPPVTGFIGLKLMSILVSKDCCVELHLQS